MIEQEPVQNVPLPCEHEWEPYKEGWEKNIRFDTFECMLCGKTFSQRQYLDEDVFRQAISDGYTFCDWGEFQSGQPYKFERNGHIIEIPVVKEEEIEGGD